MKLFLEIIIYIFSLILSVGAMILGLNTSFLGLISDPVALTLSSFSIALLLFLISDRIFSSIRQKDYVDELTNTFKNELSETRNDINNNNQVLIQSIPTIKSIIEFSSSDEAMIYATNKLRVAKIALNTKISGTGVEPNIIIGDDFTRSIKECVSNGLVYKNIVSPIFKSSSDDILASTRSNSIKGRYEYKILPNKPSSFINFILLEYDHNDSELLIGWATSSLMGTEGRAFKIIDERIITYYKEYWQSLSSEAQIAQ